MSNIILIPIIDDDHSNYPAWAPCIDSKGNKLRPHIRCQCGRYCGIGLHHIHRDGTVTASFFHEPGCGWHVYIKLQDWTGEEWLPMSKTPT